ncbi:PCNA-interacting partner-like isoform X2 [Acanthaster planci]|uniref:PCNA-interacting partner n=1 Tax=Acanthaster planci TaxID=133434 RepID=A0A8B7Y9S3_ACAPL|nr:PCNA-interacting partner-like isoform X2 [Acanthaster planci]
MADKSSEVCVLPVFHLTGYDKRQLPQILDAVEKKLHCRLVEDLPLPFDEDIIFLVGESELCDAAIPVKTPSQLLLEVFQRLKPRVPGCKTILSAESQLVVMQLCLAEHSKEKYGVYEADVSQVSRATSELNEHKLTQCDGDSPAGRCQNSPAEISASLSPSRAVGRRYKAFLSSCGMLDIPDIYQQVQTLLHENRSVAKLFRATTRLIVLQWPSQLMERKILKLLCGGASPTEISVDMLWASLGAIGDGESRPEVCDRDWEMVQNLSKDKCCPASTPKPPKSPVSSTEVLVQHVFLSFLGLLVNSRDEIALARCLSYSPSGLDHKGFTALKNAAKMKNMSMYQTAVSYITRLRLGGRSYAPGSDMSSLADHVKSLGEFVTNVQKLQVLVEEVPNTRQCITKVLLLIKNILCKCRDTVFKQAAVEKVCQKLLTKFDTLLTVFDRRSTSSPPKAVNQGGSVLGRKTLKVILAFLDQEATSPAHHNAVDVLSECTLTQTTPVQVPSFLARFRSPEVVNPKSPEHQALKERLMAPKEETKQVKIFGYKSVMAWAEPDRRNPLQEQNLNTDWNIPSQANNQPIKLWAETPPEKHNRARVFTHEFESPVGSPPSQLLTRPHQRQGMIDGTPKRPKGRVSKMADAMMDKENLLAYPREGGKAQGAGIKKKGTEVKRRVKRVLMEDTGNSQPSKKVKKGVASQKKQVALVKGQKTLNQFFRL